MKAVISRWIFIVLIGIGSIVIQYIEQTGPSSSEAKNDPGSPDTCTPNPTEKTDDDQRDKQ